jgi:uncharacterized protein YbaR (Trm112 family)
MIMSLDALLLEVLACPVDKQSLLWFEDEGFLYNPRLRRSYPVRDGIPDMLVEDASDVSDEDHQRLMGRVVGGGVPETGSGGGS